MYINYLNQDLRVSTDMHEEPKKTFLLKVEKIHCVKFLIFVRAFRQQIMDF